MNTKSKEFIGTCVENPFEDVNILARIVEGAKEVTKQTFFRHCYLHPDIVTDMCQFPNDYFYYKNHDIYFYEWSAIEYFYA